jgi:hypothetical protein
MKTKSVLKRKKTIKYVEILLVVLLVVAIASALVIYYNPSLPPEKPKLKATDYFAFTELSAEYESVNGTINVVKLKTIHFAIMPVGGNATEFHVDPGGATDPIDYYYPRIENGTSQVIDVTLVQEVLSTKNGDTYPFKLFVYCAQAEGYVTLKIPQTSMFQY